MKLTSRFIFAALILIAPAAHADPVAWLDRCATDAGTQVERSNALSRCTQVVLAHCQFVTVPEECFSALTRGYADKSDDLLAKAKSYGTPQDPTRALMCKRRLQAIADLPETMPCTDEMDSGACQTRRALFEFLLVQSVQALVRDPEEGQ